MAPVQSYAKKKACPSLRIVVEQIDEVSSLPHIALHVIKVANDPDSSAADLKDVIEGDTATCARILRYVNSSAFAVRSKITNLQQAIAFLGMKQIRNIAITINVSDLFQGDDAIGPYRRSELWRHSVAVGICSRMIAKQLHETDHEDAFLAGLLHDIGIILEDQHVHEAFEQVMLSLNEKDLLSTVERRVMDFDHTVLGAEVANLWKLPEPTKAAIRYHHMSVSYNGEHIELVRCVEVANLLCTLKDISSVGQKLVKFSAPAIAELGLAKEDVGAMTVALDAELDHSASLFQV